MKNIILITVDSLGKDESKPITDALTDFLGSGIIFENAFSAGHSTRASFLAMMCSKYTLYPDELMTYTSPTPKESGKRRYLAEELKKYGYYTFGINPTSALSAVPGSFNAGFDEYIDFLNRKNPGRKMLEVLRKNLFKAYKLAKIFLRSVRVATSGIIIREDHVIRAEKLNEKVFNNKNLKPPFFLQIHYMDAHFPLFPRKDYCNSLNQSKIIESNKYLYYFINEKSLNLDHEKHELLDKIHDWTIYYLKDQIIQLLSALKTRGLMENTVVIITADHGYNFKKPMDIIGNNLKKDKQSELTSTKALHTRITHVPLVIYGLGEGVVSRQVSHIDLAPTIIDIAAGKKIDLWYGQSVFLDAERPVISETNAYGGRATAIRTRNWAFFYEAKNRAYSLYNMENDPNEEHDLSEKHPEIMAEMKGI